MIDAKLAAVLGAAGVPLAGVPAFHVIRAGFDWVAIIEIAIMILGSVILILKKPKADK
jgi:hypothetical protein